MVNPMAMEQPPAACPMAMGDLTGEFTQPSFIH